MTEIPAPLTILALDIAKYTTGWAVGNPTWERPIWGSYRLAGPYDMFEGLRLHQWRQFLVETIAEHGVNYFAMEKLFIDMRDFNFNGTVPMAQMHGIAQELACERGFKTARPTVQAWRAHFLNGAKPPPNLQVMKDHSPKRQAQTKAKRTEWYKQRAIKVCLARNWIVVEHDQAEALGILDYTLACKFPDYRHRIGPGQRRGELEAEREAANQ